MTFAAPHWLWLLLLVPALGWFFYASWKKKQLLMAQFIHARLLPNLTEGVSVGRQKLRCGLILTAVAFLALAAAQPQWGFAWEEAKQRGLDIIIAIDTSRSMLAEDIKPNRLTRAKLAALDLMAQAKSDRLGIVTFAGSAFLQCPLTLDEDAFRQSIDVLDVDIMPQGGTALSEAINAALAAFKDTGDNHKVLILFTDGEDHEEGAVAAAEEAAKEGLRIFTIGVGTPEGELIRVADARGRAETVKDDADKPVVSHLNSALLQEIAQKANGFYLPLTGAKTVETLYERGLAPLPKNDFASRQVKRFNERFQWPLGFAFLLLLIEALMPDRAARQRNGAHSPAPSVAASLALLLASASALTASPSQAARDYQNGKYHSAYEEYQRLISKNNDDPRLHFNAGAAAFKANQFDRAAKEFSLALNAPKDVPLQEKAYYNWGNALFRLGDNESEPEKKQDNWEQAVKQYENALKLDAKDADAKFNLDYVKQKIEELKQQQQQSDKDKKDDKKDQDDKKDDKKDQKDQKDQKSQDQKDQQDKKDQQKQDQKKDDQQSKNGQDDKKQDEKDQQQAGKKDDKKDDKKDPQQAAKNDPNQKGETNSQSQANSVQMIQMTPEQAMQLLEAQKGDEKALIFQPPNTKPRSQDRQFKNW